MQWPNFAAQNPNAKALTSKPKMTFKTAELTKLIYDKIVALVASFRRTTHMIFGQVASIT